jgi:FHA domain-containing protein
VATCPAGHDSATDDYCDTCGLAMTTAAPGPPPSPAPPAGAQACDVCGAVRYGRFCEECGHDSALPAPEPDPLATAPPPDERALEPAPESQHRPLPAAPEPGSGPQGTDGWAVVVRADRTWFDEVRRREGPDAGAVEFPRYCPDRRFVLTGTQVAIGRRSRSRGTNPQIDLSGPPMDPGVSAQHALLIARPDGGWDLVDLDSTNGTALAPSADPLAANTPVALSDGDTIRLGAWTTITVERTGG